MQDADYASNFEALLTTCRQRNVAVQAIKSIAYRPWGDRPHRYATWYEPLDQQDDIDLAVWWVLGRPVFLNSVGDIGLLPKVLDAASRFERSPADQEMDGLLRRRGVEPLFV